MTKKTNDLFIKEVYNKVGDEYVFLEDYQGSKEKILCIHTSCNNRWKVTPNNFLSKGSRCPECRYGKMAKKRTKSNDEFVKEVELLSDGEYTPLDKYTNGTEKIRMTHNICGTIWTIEPITFTSRGQRCPKCTSEDVSRKFRKKTSTYKKELRELTGDEYEVLEEYGKNNKCKILHKHNLCGHTYSVRPHDFLAGNRCPICFGTPLKSREDFVRDVYKVHGEEYTVKGDYINNLTKIEILHTTCGLTYGVTPNSILSRVGCPICNKNKSKGEEEVARVIEEMDLIYCEQYGAEDLKNKNNLRFDFAVFLESGEMLLIEYDGIQHFEPIEYFGGEDTLKYQKINDSIKNDYCLKNNIELLRIPYWKFDEIEQIIKEKINFKD